MARVNIVQKTTLIENKRLDADFFQKRYVELDKKIVGAISIQRSASTVDLQSNGAFRVIFNILNDNQPKEVPYIRSGNVGDFFINKDELHSISKRAHSKLLKTHTVVGDILMARKGKIGGATLITKDDVGYNSNDNVTNIRLKNNDFLPAYFVAFWNSKFGLQQVERFATGNVQPWLSMKQIRMLRTVKLDYIYQKEISDIVLEAYSKDKDSKNRYQQAAALLEKELGLDNITFEKPKYTTATYSNIIETRRGDAEFYNPKLRSYYKYLSEEKGFKLKKISHFTKVMKFSNPDYAEKGTPIITQKHLTNIAPENYEGFPIASNEWVSKYPEAVIREDDLLFYSVGAYLGKTNIWFNEDKAVHASFITMLRSENKIDAGYLMVLLNSKYGILQSKVYQSGSSQPYIYPKDIRQFLIPVVEDDFKQKLYDLIKQSFILKKESQKLLEQAKNRVEELIEAAAIK